MSEFAVHGLAYLGVFLVFISILGFVIFAFAGVEAGFRPIAEALIPVFLFGAAAFLRRREAPFVANALLLLGGAVTPIVLFAAIADDAPFPPDLEGAPLVLTLTIISVVLAVVYAAIGHRYPGSPIRYLAAPMLWVGTGVLGFAFEKEASAPQAALVAGVIVATAGIAAAASQHPLARPTRAVAIPALGVAYAFTVVFAWGADWPPLPMLAAGIAVIAATEILPPRFGLPWVAQAATIAVTAAAVAPAWGPAPIGVAATVAYLGLAEVWARRDPTPAVLPVLLAGAGVGVAVSALEAEMLLAGSLLGAIWCQVRHLKPLDLALRIPIAAGACVLPVAAFAALADLTSTEIALAAAGVALAGAAIAARIWQPGDDLYRYAIPIAAGAVVIATAPLGMDAAVPRSDLNLLALAALGGALALAAGMSWRGFRVWAAGAGFSWAFLLLLRAWEIGPDHRAAAGAIVAAALVVLSIVWGVREAGHLALLGHGLAVAALIAAGTEQTRLIAVLAWTAGWIVQTAAAEAGRAPFSELLQSFLPERRRSLILTLAPITAEVSVPFALALGVEQSGWLEGERGRMG